MLYVATVRRKWSSLFYVLNSLLLLRRRGAIGCQPRVPCLTSPITQSRATRSPSGPKHYGNQGRRLSDGVLPWPPKPKLVHPLAFSLVAADEPRLPVPESQRWRRRRDQS